MEENSNLGGPSDFGDKFELAKKGMKQAEKMTDAVRE